MNYKFHKPGTEEYKKTREFIMGPNATPDEVVRKYWGDDYLKALKSHYKVASLFAPTQKTGVSTNKILISKEISELAGKATKNKKVEKAINSIMLRIPNKLPTIS